MSDNPAAKPVKDVSAEPRVEASAQDPQQAELSPEDLKQVAGGGDMVIMKLVDKSSPL